jgi:hypothetical protein
VVGGWCCVVVWCGVVLSNGVDTLFTSLFHFILRKITAYNIPRSALAKGTAQHTTVEGETERTVSTSLRVRILSSWACFEL